MQKPICSLLAILFLSLPMATSVFANAGHYEIDLGEGPGVCVAYKNAVADPAIPAPLPCGPRSVTTSEAIQWVRWENYFDSSLLDVTEAQREDLSRRLDYFYWQLGRNMDPGTLKRASRAQLADKDFVSYRSNYWDSMDALHRQRSVTQVALRNDGHMEVLYRNDSCQAGPIGNEIVFLNGALSDVDFRKTSEFLKSTRVADQSITNVVKKSAAPEDGETQFDLFLFGGRYYIQEWHWPEQDLSAGITIHDPSNNNRAICHFRWIAPAELAR